MRIAITRPSDDAEEFAGLLQAAGHQPLVAPVLEIELLTSFDLQLDGVAGLVATSRNGLRALSALPLPENVRRLPVHVVGGATAAFARSLGFERLVEGGWHRSRPGRGGRRRAPAGRRHVALSAWRGYRLRPRRAAAPASDRRPRGNRLPKPYGRWLAAADRCRIPRWRRRWRDTAVATGGRRLCHPHWPPWPDRGSRTIAAFLPVFEGGGGAIGELAGRASADVADCRLAADR